MYWTPGHGVELLFAVDGCKCWPRKSYRRLASRKIAESQTGPRFLGMMREVFVHFALCSLNRLANRLSAIIFLRIILSMPETSIQTPSGFNQLPKAEQVRYLQA